MDASTFSEGSSVDPLIQAMAVVFTAAGVVAIPKVPVDRTLRFLSSASPAAFAGSLNTSGETSAALATPTGFKPQILLSASGASQIQTRQIVSADQQIYISGSGQGACIIGWEILQ